MLESAKFQLKATKEKVEEENADYEMDKKEDVAVASKLTEIEEELKVGWFVRQELSDLKLLNI